MSSNFTRILFNYFCNRYKCNYGNSQVKITVLKDRCSGIVNKLIYIFLENNKRKINKYLGSLHLIIMNKNYLCLITTFLTMITFDFNYSLRYQKLISLYFKMASVKDDLFLFHNQQCDVTKTRNSAIQRRKIINEIND